MEKAMELLGMDENVQSEDIVRKFEAAVAFVKDQDIDLNDIDNDLADDYVYVRKTLHSLIELGQKALAGAIDSAFDTHHPQSYGVVGGIMKQLADTTETLIKLKEKINKAQGISKNTVPNEQTNIQNNYIVTGTTEDFRQHLDKILQQQTEELNLIERRTNNEI